MSAGKSFTARKKKKKKTWGANSDLPKLPWTDCTLLKGAPQTRGDGVPSCCQSELRRVIKIGMIYSQDLSLKRSFQTVAETLQWCFNIVSSLCLVLLPMFTLFLWDWALVSRPSFLKIIHFNKSHALKHPGGLQEPGSSGEPLSSVWWRDVLTRLELICSHMADLDQTLNASPKEENHPVTSFWLVFFPFFQGIWPAVAHRSQWIKSQGCCASFPDGLSWNDNRVHRVGVKRCHSFARIILI